MKNTTHVCVKYRYVMQFKAYGQNIFIVVFIVEFFTVK